MAISTILMENIRYAAGLGVTGGRGGRPLGPPPLAAGRS
jgi:hypothetical protein